MKNLFEGLAVPGHCAAMPILAFPGATLAKCSVKELVTDAAAQVAAQEALHARLGTTFWLSAMDLSVEPEEFGAEIRLSDAEVPTVVDRLVVSAEQVDRLAVPAVGTRRSAIYLETVRRLSARAGGLPVLAGMMGPFTLAARLYGISEALVDTIDQPELIHRLLAKANRFLLAYARAFKAAGSDGLIIAEPMAGLIAPAALREFSSNYIRELVTGVADNRFAIIVHNCGARLSHLADILACEARCYHFGQPMDMESARKEAPADVVLSGNLDPSGVFVRSTPDQVRDCTTDLLRRLGRGPGGFILSSGCDLPPNTPIANLEAFFGAVRSFRPAA